MAKQQEPDFPPGHPARCDYDPSSPEAKAWAHDNVFPMGERDFPRGHVKAVDTPGNMNHVEIVPGIDPTRPELEQFTGRTPEQAAAAREVYAAMSATAKESPAPLPVMAVDPPRELNTRRVAASADGTKFTVFCPGCKSGHEFDSRWTFNGSYELPTFTPSMRVSDELRNTVCHSYVTNGRIQFLDDSTHELRGQAVDLPPVAQMQETINASRS